MSNKVIKFSAEWCGPCRAMAPTFQKFQEEHANDNVEITDVNVDVDFELAEKFQVRTIPNIVFVKDEEVIERVVGVANLDRLNSIYSKSFAV